MNKTSVFIGLVVIVIIGIIGLVKYQSGGPANPTESAMESKDSMMSNESKESSQTDTIMGEKTEQSSESMEGQFMKQSGSYKDYSAEAVESEQLKGNKVVLFFHAPWCPFCKVANAAFTTRSKDIPEGITVLKTDYDSNTKLKKKYGVTYQHTFVQIDTNGNAITKWNGGDIDALKESIK